MAEYREQVKHLREWTVLDIQNRPAHTIRMMQTAADTIEKFDAVPVVHGRWVYDEAERLYHCDNCGSECAFKYDGQSTWKEFNDYCPNCGADMRERKDGDG
jgi:hypothetical protein